MAGAEGKFAGSADLARQEKMIIHRSEVHAQPETEKDSRGARLRRSQCAGFATILPPGRLHSFKPMGQPLDGDEVKAKNDIKVRAHDKLQAPKDQQKEKASFALDFEATDGSPLEDGTLEKDDLDGTAEKKKSSGASWGLYGKDLQRTSARTKNADGFGTLRLFIKESETRVQQVKSKLPDLVYGLDYNVDMLDYFMPPRHLYPPVTEKRGAHTKRGGSNRDAKVTLPPASGAAGPHSARAAAGRRGAPGPSPPAPPLSARNPRPPPGAGGMAAGKPCPGRPALPCAQHRQFYVSPLSEFGPQRLPIRLKSLQDFIDDSSGPYRAAGGDEAGKRGRNDFKRKFLQDLEKLEKKFWRRVHPQGTTTLSDEKKGGDGATSGGGSDALDPQETDAKGKKDPYEQLVSLLQETDPSISPVDRLRATLKKYQQCRETHSTSLQQALYSMDADRLNTLKQKALNLNPTSEGPTSVPQTGCQLMRLEAEKEMLLRLTGPTAQKRYAWYRELWMSVQNDKRDLPAVAHFIFDFMKAVLEAGEKFTREMYFRMLENIDNFEFTSVIATIIVGMVQGIDRLNEKDVLEWFQQNRSEVPEAIDRLMKKRRLLGDNPGRGRKTDEEESEDFPRGNTFLTES